MQREAAFDAFAGDQAAHRGAAGGAAALEGDHGASEDLDALLVAFLDQVVDVDGIADPEVGDRGLHVLEFERAQDVHGVLVGWKSGLEWGLGCSGGLLAVAAGGFRELLAG
jgi:hypothetical protein